jgi:hypothetical protein
MRAFRIFSQFFLALACIGVLAGCKGPSILVRKTSKGFLPRNKPEDVEVLQAMPTSSSVKVASMYASRYKVKYIFQIDDDLKKEAAVLGADAVVILHRNQEGSRAWAAVDAIYYPDKKDKQEKRDRKDKK